MLRASAILSCLLLVTFIVLTVASRFHPFDLRIYSTNEKKWFPAPNFVPSAIGDLIEPNEDGEYHHPAWDIGLFPTALYIRQSQYVSTQIRDANGAWIDNPEWDTFQLYDHHLPLGIRWRRVWRQGSTSAFVAIPPWLILLTLALLPTWQLRRSLRRRRNSPRGLCPTCHYDLRAHLATAEPATKNQELRTPIPALPPRCPECGTPIPAAPPFNPPANFV